MNIYNAILKAADHIEGHPTEFKWMSVEVPKSPECGTPGCALGWIGTFAAVGANKYGYDGISLVAAGHEDDISDQYWLGKPLLGITQAEFYVRMNELFKDHGWKHNAAVCAKTLRAYAEKYHGQQKPISAPDWNAIAAKQTIAADARSQELV